MIFGDTITGLGTTDAITLTAPSLSSSPIALKLNASNSLTLTGPSISTNSAKLATGEAPASENLALLRQKAA